MRNPFRRRAPMSDNVLNVTREDAEALSDAVWEAREAEQRARLGGPS
jgi:hypothetical protein